MERIIDLDQAAAQIVARRQRWTAGGLVAGPVTWRDEAAAWPQPLEEDRSRVEDPDSVGIRIAGPADAELSVVLFRGGWADVEFLADLADEVVSEAPQVTSPNVFGELLDDYVFRAFGRSGPVSAA
ncbi:hypothetical protein H9Y04_45500 [Streptomyces sp. TRM66268-LWL]|uniref:Uncharacterized protein n=1 Tax=Streptomyces polyasparticus TaxID=2767826 RepID=A0ABR7SXW7_9ACTN|nr:hypothetical protein [Streptomyces polyasparticus]MBC9719729.1 hypothetical protein [Streptomyces polyasparticus]